jgi:hypothetical protein
MKSKWGRKTKAGKSNVEQIARSLKLTAPEDKAVAKIIHKRLPYPGGGMKPKNIEHGNSAIDKIGREIAEKCKVTYDGPGMSMGGASIDKPSNLRRVDMFFIPNAYSSCLKNTDKGSSFRQLSLYYMPDKKL